MINSERLEIPLDDRKSGKQGLAGGDQDRVCQGVGEAGAPLALLCPCRRGAPNGGGQPLIPPPVAIIIPCASLDYKANQLRGNINTKNV